MSVDPVAAAAAAAAATGDAAGGDADARALRAALPVGSVVAARVLRAGPGGALLEIAGRRIAAELPAGVRAGDVLQVRVASFGPEGLRLALAGESVPGPPAAAAQRSAPAATLAQILEGNPPAQTADFARPLALLRALRLPVTPGALAAAAAVLERPERVAEALQTLADAAAAAQQTAAEAPAGEESPSSAAAFLARIDPRSPVLAEQVAAFVEQVVVGPEPAVAALLTLLAGAAGDDPDAAAGAPVARERAQRGLKAAVASAAGEGSAGSTPLAEAAGHALAALTAVQLRAAEALAAQPGALAFVLPLAYEGDRSAARVRIAREGARGTDAGGEEAFRIAVLLDTPRLGPVAAELVTVERTVSVELRAAQTETVRALDGALGTLTARLETHRYRVAAVGARLVPRAEIVVDETPPTQPGGAGVDRSA